MPFFLGHRRFPGASGPQGSSGSGGTGQGGNIGADDGDEDLYS